jgi:hypothetical protein
MNFLSIITSHIQNFIAEVDGVCDHNGFRADILRSLNMVRLYRNMSQLRV